MGDESAQVTRMYVTLFRPVASRGAVRGELLMAYEAVCLGEGHPVPMTDLAVRAGNPGSCQQTDPAMRLDMLAAWAVPGRGVLRKGIRDKLPAHAVSASRMAARAAAVSGSSP